jgi:hypothetical protein
MCQRTPPSPPRALSDSPKTCLAGVPYRGSQLALLQGKLRGTAASNISRHTATFPTRPLSACSATQLASAYSLSLPRRGRLTPRALTSFMSLTDYGLGGLRWVAEAR